MIHTWPIDGDSTLLMNILSISSGQLTLSIHSWLATWTNSNIPNPWIKQKKNKKVLLPSTNVEYISSINAYSGREQFSLCPELLYNVHKTNHVLCGWYRTLENQKGETQTIRGGNDNFPALSLCERPDSNPRVQFSYQSTDILHGKITSDPTEIIMKAMQELSCNKRPRLEGRKKRAKWKSIYRKVFYQQSNCTLKVCYFTENLKEQNHF